MRGNHRGRILVLTGADIPDDPEADIVARHRVAVPGKLNCARRASSPKKQSNNRDHEGAQAAFAATSAFSAGSWPAVVNLRTR